MKRYALTNFYEEPGSIHCKPEKRMIESPDGEWVKFADIERLACQDIHRTDSGTFCCWLPEGHDGPHEAAGETWP